MKYTEAMKNRIEGKEKGVPVRLMHKSNLKDFCQQVGISLPLEYATFETPDDIILDGLPDRFVLKPAYASTADGVMVLSRDGETFYDSMSDRSFTFDGILEEQSRVFKKYTKVKNKVTIAEQRIASADGEAVPVDYKFLGFQGEIGVIIRIDRNHERLRLSYYDGDFRPIVDDRIRFKESIADREWVMPPSDWRSLLNLARRVSTAVPTGCARIDLFSDVSGPVLGEITLTPGSFYYSAGHTLSPDEDARLGRMWSDANDRLGRDV